MPDRYCGNTESRRVRPRRTGLTDQRRQTRQLRTRERDSNANGEEPEWRPARSIRKGIRFHPQKASKIDTLRKRKGPRAMTQALQILTDIGPQLLTAVAICFAIGLFVR